MPKGNITVNDPEARQEDIERDTPILEAIGGRFIVRGGHAGVMEGETLLRNAVTDFPSCATAMAAYNGPEYQGVVEILLRRSASGAILVKEGV